MIPEQQTDPTVTIMITVIAIFFAIVFLVYFTATYTKYSQEMKYIESEIRRSEGSEKKYWIKKKRQLWKSFLPFHK